MTVSPSLRVPHGTACTPPGRSFTTILGDFDVEVLYERGFGAMAVFTTAALFGNVVMLNLLIAIVRPSQDDAPLPWFSADRVPSVR